VFLALAGGAEPLDLPGAPVDDEVVLDQDLRKIFLKY